MKLIGFIPVLLFYIHCLGYDVTRRAQRLYIPPDYISYRQQKTAYTEMIPAGLAPTQSEAAVFNQFADRGVSLFFTSDQMKATPLGRTADTVQNTLKTDFEAVTAQTKHQFSFQILALQNAARLKYTGWLEAIADLHFGENRSELEFSRKVTDQRTLFLNHSQIPDSYSMLAGVRVSF